jgi:hypothetical protein
VLDFTWTPDVPPHLLACGTIWTCANALTPFVEGRWGFFADGWVRNEQGAAACRWRIEIHKHAAIFSLRSRLRLDPARMTTDRLLRAWRRLAAYRDWHWQRLAALSWTGALFHWPEGAETAWVYHHDALGMSGTVRPVAEAPPGNDHALAARVHACWLRLSEVNRCHNMVGQALLRLVASQLPGPAPGAAPRVIRVAGETMLAEVERTHNACTWRVRFDWTPDAVEVR